MTDRSKIVPAGGKQRKRATLSDVAAVAGVSVSTASAVLGNKSHCFASQATRKLVTDAAQQVGYRPNVLARGLRGEKTQTIGILMHGFNQGIIVNSKLQSIEDNAWRHDYRLLIGTHKDDRKRLQAYLDEFLGRYVDGVLFWSANQHDLEFIEQVKNAGAAVMAIESAPGLGVPEVVIDREHGAYLQIKHLLDIGRKKPAFFLTSHRGHFGQAKVDGLTRGLEEAGLSLKDFAVLEEPRPRDIGKVGVELADRLIKSGAKFDSIITTSDRVALSAMATLIRRGYRVPQDVAVVGYDDEFPPEALIVPLTSVHQPVEIGEHVFNMLLPQIKGEAFDEKNISVTLKPTLKVRQSTVPDGVPDKETKP